MPKRRPTPTSDITIPQLEGERTWYVRFEHDARNKRWRALAWLQRFGQPGDIHTEWHPTRDKALEELQSMLNPKWRAGHTST